MAFLNALKRNFHFKTKATDNQRSITTTCFTSQIKEDYIANRTRDKVIYIRVAHNLMREFEKQKSESGYKSNADFIDYLLRVNKCKQIDGVTLKEFTEFMNDVSHELKK